VQDGTLIINGDSVGSINAWIADAKIVAHGGNGTIVCDYNVTNPGKTTVTAISPQTTSNPSPGNGADNVNVHADLGWTPGSDAVSYDVYFGTNPNPGAAEFKGNQTGTTFDPGLLSLNTTYYWRIDAVNPAHPDSPWAGYVWSFKTQAVSSAAGKIVYPWRSTTAIVKSGQTFEVWFIADSGQNVNSVELKSQYKTVSTTKSIVTGNWVYDQMSGNQYNTHITVTVPSNTPADRYDLVLKTSSGDVISYGGVKVVTDYKDDYYLMHISDGHLYQGGYDTDVLFARKTEMVKIANIMDVQIIIETGDNSYNVRNNPDRLVRYFLGDSSGNKGMAQASAATFLIPGDHCAPYGNDWAQGTEQQNADFFNNHWGRQHYCFIYGNGRFMPFNNAWDVSTSSAKNHQYQINEALAWLDGAGSGGNFWLTAGHCYDKMHKSIHDHRTLKLVLAGDKHHVGTSNPYPFAAGSPSVAYIARSIRDHFEICLFRINNTNGTFTTPAGTTSLANVLYSGNQDAPSTWVPNLELTYSQSNNGAAFTNSAQIVNRYGFPIYGAKVRFVMPKGAVYVISNGTIEQQFDGHQYHVVDVRIDVDANSTAVVEITSEDSSPTITIDTPNTVTWVGEPVQLTATIDDAGSSQLCIEWTTSHPENTTFLPTNTVPEPVVNVNRAVGEVTLSAAVWNPAYPLLTDADTTVLYVAADACQAAAVAGLVPAYVMGLTESKCVIDIAALAAVAAEWLTDYTLTEPAALP
jgi:hypothetical protein